MASLYRPCYGLHGELQRRLHHSDAFFAQLGRFSSVHPPHVSDTHRSSCEQFKIDQAGLLSGSVADGQWAQGELIANNNTWTTTIPASLKPGNYFLRHELLAIHTPNQPQFYPECAQLIITGSGSAEPSGSYLVKFPGAYSM